MIPKAYINTVLDLWSTKKKQTWCRLIGNSMAPLLCHGDALLVQPGNRNIRIGDVIIFKSSQRQCAHRAVGITFAHGRKRFLVKGDNGYHFDRPVLPEQVLAKVLRVEGAYGTLYLDSTFWSFINFFVAIYSYVEARRHESDTLFWRTIDRIFTRCHNFRWCRNFHRRELYKRFVSIKSNVAYLEAIKGEQINENE
jgi:signal peptidase I